MAQITVLLSDASRIGCELLKDGIEEHAQDVEVVACYTTGDAMVDAARQRSPDLVLLSANLEDGAMAGFEALREIRELQVRSRVVMLLDSPDREAVVSAFRGGAKGVFVRQQPISALCTCIRAVHAGQVWADSSQLTYLLEAFAAASPFRFPPPSGQVLTAREEQIAQLVVEGFSNRDISRKLNLSEHTVKNYLFRIFDKLGFSTRVELAMYMVHRKTA